MKEYDWFRIHVEKNYGDGYLIHVTSSLDSREFEEDFAPPFNQRRARELLRQIEESLKPGTEPLRHEKMMEIGRDLYTSIFSAEIEKYFKECLRNTREKTRGLRIELEVDPLYLRRLPWELLHDGKDFLALSATTPIVRLFLQAEVPEFPEIRFPMGILFVGASPVGSSAPIDVGGEIRLLCKGVAKAVKEGRVCLKCYSARKIKSQDFLDDIRSRKFHVLHVSSHGAFVDAIDKGLLQLEDEEGRAIPVSVDTLGAWIKDSEIQMVFLNACQTAVGSVRTPLADLSHVFLDRGKGAVVAMQFSVPNQSAITFCETFYSQLVQQEPIESALSEARKRIVDLVVGLERIDWAIPTLYIGGKGILRVRGEREIREPHKPLPEVGVFIGRDKELNELTESLVDPEVSVISVDGFGGIGKSTTVNELVRDIGHLFADVCWINCRPKISHDKAVEEINQMLLHHGVGFTPDELAKYFPEGKNDRIAYGLERKDEGFLLVFDNFDSVKDDLAICGLVKRVCEGKRTKVFVTLRTPMSLAREQRFFRLNKLEEDDALLLMRRLAEQYGINRVKRAKDTALRDINAKVDGHPKAIQVVIPHLKSKAVKVVLEELPQVLAGDIAPILKWSFDLLTAEEREFLFEISVYDGEVPYDALKAVHVGDYPIAVTELVEKNMLSYDTMRELYSLHPLIHDYAYDQLRRERRRKLHRLAYRYLLSEEVKDHLSAIYHMYKAEDLEVGMYATSKILETFILHGFWTEAKSLCEYGLSASRKIESLESEAYFLFYMARMLHDLGNPDEAEELQKQSLQIKEKLGDQSGISKSLHQLATIEQHRGNYDEAEKLYKQSLQIEEKLGDKRGIASTLHQLGRISEARNQLNPAKEYFETALEIFRQIQHKADAEIANKSLKRIKTKMKQQK
jgi:tetratricopeptide (TPR) repeat protein